MRVLGPADAIAEGTAVAYPPPPGGLIGLIGVRHSGDIKVFVNSCPHLGVSLDWAAGRFLDEGGTHIVCATHGARFRLEDGVCDRGICLGDRLEAVVTQINDGMVCVPEDAGQ